MTDRNCEVFKDGESLGYFTDLESAKRTVAEYKQQDSKADVYILQLRPGVPIWRYDYDANAAEWSNREAPIISGSDP